jgi:ankyrin repeat protein
MSAFRAAEALVAGGARTDLYCAAAMGDAEAVRSFFDEDGQLKSDAAYTCRVRFLSLVTPRDHRQQPRDIVCDAMYAAVRHKRVDVARVLMERRVDVGSRAFLGATLLHWAYYAGSRPIIAMLLERGADPDARDDTFGCTPRAFAICAPARLGTLELVTERLDEDPSLATINEGRGTPLHEAVRAGHEAIVRLLVARGATRWRATKRQTRKILPTPQLAAVEVSG